MFKKNFLLISIIVLLLLPSFALAIDVPWWPIVPCGLNEPAQGEPRLNDSYYQKCGRCDLFKLFKNIIDFILEGLMPPVAALLFVWGGFLILMGGGNPGLVAKGRTIFWNTFMGVVIISASWLLTNTLIKSLAETSVTNPNTPWYQFECVGTGGGGAGAVTITTASLPDATQNQSYSQTLSATGGTTPYYWSVSSGNLPAGLNLSSSGTISGTPTATGTSTFTIKAEDSSNPKKSATKQLGIVISEATSSACNQNFGLTPSSGCSGTNCVVASDITPTHGCESHDNVCLLSQGAFDRAKKFVATFNSLTGGSCTLRLASTIQGGTGPGVSLCHKPGNSKSGTCADFNLIPNHDSCYLKFYQAAKDSGAVVSFLDEYVQSCKPANATGGNIHVNF